MNSWQLLFTVISIVFFSSSVVWSQESRVLNVQFIQRADSKVEVTYDLKGKASKKYAVKLRLMKFDTRRLYRLGRVFLSGDIM